MLVLNMQYKLWSMPTQSNPCNYLKWYFPFNSCIREKSSNNVVESVLRKDIVDVLVGHKNDTLLFLLGMVDFDYKGRENDNFYLRQGVHPD